VVRYFFHGSYLWLVGMITHLLLIWSESVIYFFIDHKISFSSINFIRRYLSVVNSIEIYIIGSMYFIKRYSIFLYEQCKARRAIFIGWSTKYSKPMCSSKITKLIVKQWKAASIFLINFPRCAFFCCLSTLMCFALLDSLQHNGYGHHTPRVNGFSFIVVNIFYLFLYLTFI
jgi:hypothetical protein